MSNRQLDTRDHKLSTLQASAASASSSKVGGATFISVWAPVLHLSPMVRLVFCMRLERPLGAAVVIRRGRRW